MREHVLVLFFLMLFQASNAQINTYAKSREITLVTTGTITISPNSGSSALTELNFTGITVPQDAVLSSYECINCNMTTNELGFW